MEERVCDLGTEGEERKGRNRPERKGGESVKKGERGKDRGKESTGKRPRNRMASFNAGALRERGQDSV